MTRRWLSLVLLLAVLRATGAAAGTPARARTTAPRLLLAHYMPWFEADPARGQWGWHWTMNHFHPDHTVNGRREAASHYTPLIGLYDSGDPDALDCQVLLMKLAGIDGVIVDWYGTDDYLDYGLIQRNTLRLIQSLKRAGLRFAICYEDQTVPQLIAGHRLAADQAVPHGQSQMEWLQAHWFTDPSYVSRDGRPVLLTFGAGYYQGSQWDQILAPLTRPPALFTEQERRLPAVGAFAWPQPGGGAAASEAAQDRFYAAAPTWPQFLPCAYPRFDDIYVEAGVHASWGHIDDRDGRTYADTLQRALKSGAGLVQLVTWNDWGEGTMIEPSVEFGYRDLETTQRLRRQFWDRAFRNTAQDLRLPVTWYRLKKQSPNDAAMQARLATVSRLLFAGKLDRARALLPADPPPAEPPHPGRK